MPFAHDTFLDHPVVHAYVSMRAFGNLTRDVDAVIGEIRTRTRPGATVAVAGCRRTDKVLALARALPDRRFEIVDAAAERVETIRAAGLGNTRIHAAEPTELPIEPDAAEIVVGLYAIHEIHDLEPFWARCARILRPGGVVLAQEYVGAPDFAWPAPVQDAANRALAELVPPEHKTHHDVVGGELAAALCAAELRPITRAHEIVATCTAAGFELTGFAHAGCALLQPVLAGQIDSFDPRRWDHSEVLSRLFREEDRLMQAGTLGDAFAMFVARPSG